LVEISVKNDKFGHLNPVLRMLGGRTTMVDSSLESLQ